MRSVGSSLPQVQATDRLAHAQQQLRQKVYGVTLHIVDYIVVLLTAGGTAEVQ